jgi:uncharacterized protein involved in exopolysaccharide biosynthesis
MNTKMDDSTIASSGSELLTPAIHPDLAEAEESGEALVLKATRFLRLCWARRKLIFVIVFIGILISLLAALSKPNIYTSTTTLMPPDSASSYSGLMSLLTSSSASAALGSEALGLNNKGDLFVSILGSRNVLDALIARFDLTRHYKEPFLEDTRKDLEGDTKLVQDRKSGIITISVSATNPELAANLAQAYVAELNRVISESSTSGARRERIFLEGRLKEVKQQLDEASSALSQFSTKSGAIDVSAQAKSMMDAGLRLQAELIDGRSRLAALRQVYSEDNSRVRAAEARDAELQRQIDAMGGLHKAGAVNSDDTASDYPTVDQLPALGVTYYDLERTVKVDEALWENLTKQYEVAKVQEAEQIPSVRVLDSADVPMRHSGPNRRLIIMIGALLSLLLALVFVATATVWSEMDAQDEPKRLILDVVDGVLSREHWYWKLPGMRWIRSRIQGTSAT